MNRFDREGGTLGVSVARILAVLVSWSRFGGGLSVPFLEGPADMAIAAVFWPASVCALFGLFSRASLGLTGAACLSAWWIQGVLRHNPAMESHHVFAQGLLCALLALTPCGGALSLDRVWRGVPDRGPVWGQALLTLQVSVIYLGAAWEKTELAWFDGTRMTHFLMQVSLGSDPVEPWVAALACAAAVLTWVAEVGLAAAVWVPRARLAGLIVGLVFHGLVYAGMPVGTYSATMFVFLIATVDGEQADRWWTAVRGGGESVAGRPWALILLPLLALPLLRTAGLPVWAPSLRTFAPLVAEVACDGQPCPVEPADPVRRPSAL